MSDVGHKFGEVGIEDFDGEPRQGVGERAKAVPEGSNGVLASLSNLGRGFKFAVCATALCAASCVTSPEKGVVADASSGSGGKAGVSVPAEGQEFLPGFLESFYLQLDEDDGTVWVNGVATEGGSFDVEVYRDDALVGSVDGVSFEAGDFSEHIDAEGLGSLFKITFFDADGNPQGQLPMVVDDELPTFTEMPGV